MVTIVEKMATCKFYAHIYDEGLRVRLATSTTTVAFDKGLDTSLKDLYAAVGVFLKKAEYFDPENSGIVLNKSPTSIAFLMGFVYSGEKDWEPAQAIFSHHATSDPRHFGQGKEG